MGKVVKPAGKNVPQTRKAAGKSYQRQMARSAGKIRFLAPKPPDNKKR